MQTLSTSEPTERRKAGRPCGTGTGVRREESLRIPASANWLDWVRDLARDQQMPMTELARRALEQFARNGGFPEPPRK
jgi:hypothetical protein